MNCNGDMPPNKNDIHAIGINNITMYIGRTMLLNIFPITISILDIVVNFKTSRVSCFRSMVNAVAEKIIDIMALNKYKAPVMI